MPIGAGGSQITAPEYTANLSRVQKTLAVIEPASFMLKQSGIGVDQTLSSACIFSTIVVVPSVLTTLIIPSGNVGSISIFHPFPQQNQQIGTTSSGDTSYKQLP
jgi:hypothetical protein